MSDYYRDTTVTDNQTSGGQKTQIVDASNNTIGPQYPLAVDGDSVYSKDIDTTNSSIGDFSGAITDLFDSRTSTITTTTDNPSLTIALKRPIKNHEITLVTASGNFSNVTIVAKDASGSTLETIDDSANNTNYTANSYPFTSIDKWCVVDISFTTTDTVTLSFASILKTGTVDAELVALKPDGTRTHINATAGGNLKTSIEEIEATVSTDMMLEVARGNKTGITHVNKFGENPSLPVNTTEDIWDAGGTYSFPTTATITHIRSAVDSATTQGMTIEVQGLDASWDLVTQTKDLDGTNSTTEVALDTALIRVFRMKVLEDSVADQDIWAGDNDFAVGDAKAVIQAGNNQTLMAIYTVPNGKTAYMTQYYADNETDETRIPDSARFNVWVADRENGYEFQLKHQRAVPQSGDGIVQNFKPYLKITQKSDIKVSCTISGAVGEDGHPHAGFDLILVDN